MHNRSDPRPPATPRPSRQFSFLRGAFNLQLSTFNFLTTRWLIAALLLCIPLRATALAPLPVYTDQLVNGFQDWGWATRNYANTNPPVRSGTSSISVTITSSGYQGLQIWHSDLNSAAYSSLTFWLNGGTNGGQKLQLFGLLHIGSTNNASAGKYYSLGSLQTNVWQQFTVPLSSLGVANTNNFTGFVIQDRLNAAQPTFYVDDIQLDPAPPPNPVHLSLKATQAVRSVDARWFAVNTAIWDGNFDTPTTISSLNELGTRLLRCPGGSLSDEYHWSTDTNLTNTWRWTTSFANFVHVATNVGAQAIITVNYGTGSSNEAAAWVAYANSSVTNTRSFGVDQFGANWQTAGYWAAVRAAAPLAKDDGKNFLRLSRSAPFGFKYWEIGNECHGTWETDANTNAPFRAHDGWTYATRAAGYLQQMRAVDPTIKIGIVVSPGEDSYVNANTNHPALNPRTGQTHYGWTPVLLATLNSAGVAPDFAIHHRYPEYSGSGNPAGSDNDAALLQSSAAWAGDAANLRQQITDYFNPAGTNLELVVTENNSDAGAQGKQSTSLVNGLYYADSFAQLALTEFNAFVWWDLRNGTDTNGWFDASLYGWRTYGDLGMINGLSTRHPTFYAAKLMQYFAQPGDTILGASSEYSLLSAYAARRASGALSLLILNKDTTTSFNAQIALTGFLANSSAMLRFYGIPQDDAARTNAPIQMQDIATNNFAGVNASPSFNYTAPPLSLSLFTLPPAPPSLAVLPPPQPAGQPVLQLQGQPNVRYVLQSSSNLTAWLNVSTNTLSTSTLSFTNPVPPGAALQFWRAVWQP
ncbi:MAG TPA: alpha-L-arabinofuranosidase [Candidatus Binatia bacterium]|jgi:alpha-N-arabinofuranosidase|nr:alpha-L-arabinofuranosidase [Candidatus Binatia bacterium]